MWATTCGLSAGGGGCSGRWGRRGAPATGTSTRETLSRPLLVRSLFEYFRGGPLLRLGKKTRLFRGTLLDASGEGW